MDSITISGDILPYISVALKASFFFKKSTCAIYTTIFLGCFKLFSKFKIVDLIQVISVFFNKIFYERGISKTNGQIFMKFKM